MHVIALCLPGKVHSHCVHYFLLPSWWVVLLHTNKATKLKNFSTLNPNKTFSSIISFLHRLQNQTRGKKVLHNHVSVIIQFHPGLGLRTVFQSQNWWTGRILCSHSYDLQSACPVIVQRHEISFSNELRGKRQLSDLLLYEKKKSYLNELLVEVTAIGAAPYFKALSYIFQITKKERIGIIRVHSPR